MSKFDKPFAEVRLYIPIESDVWKDFEQSKAYASLAEGGLLVVQTNNKARKGRKKHAKH